MSSQNKVNLGRIPDSLFMAQQNNGMRGERRTERGLLMTTIAKIELDGIRVAPAFDYKLLEQKFTDRKKITIRFDYPLDDYIDCDFESEDGFTVATIISLVQTKYAELYADPSNPHGIWGHDINSLFIEGIEDHGDYIELSIGS